MTKLSYQICLPNTNGAQWHLRTETPIKNKQKRKTNLQASGQNADICPTAHSEDGAYQQTHTEYQRSITIIKKNPREVTTHHFSTHFLSFYPNTSYNASMSNHRDDWRHQEPKLKEWPWMSCK